MKSKRLLFLLVGALAFSCVSTGTSSCSPELTPAEHGELANGSFHYECVDVVSDPACENAPDIPAFQKRIAVGAQFSMWFVVHENIPNDLDVPSIQSPIPSYVERVYEDDMVKLRILVPDFAPLQSQNYNQQVHDFVHLEGVEIAELLIARQRVTDENTWGDWDAKWEEIEETLVITTGETLVVRVFPRSAELDILPGTILDYQWTPPDDTVALFNPNVSPTLVNLVGISPGTSSLQVALGEMTHTINVVVEDPNDADGGVDGGSHNASDQGRF